MMTRPHDARVDRPIARTIRQPLISKNPRWNRQRLQEYPCWCGESLVTRYRMLVDCCAAGLLALKPHILNLDLAVDTPKPERLYTQRRADGSDIYGEYTLMVALDDKDWAGAEADAQDLDEQQEYWLETWVLERRQVRKLGPEPVEDEDDDERRGDQVPLRVVD